MENFLAQNVVFSSKRIEGEEWFMIKLSENDANIQIPVAKTLGLLLQLLLLICVETKFRYGRWSPENWFVGTTAILRILLILKAAWWARSLIYLFDWICPRAELRTFNWFLKQPSVQLVTDCGVVQWLAWESVALGSRVSAIYYVCKFVPAGVLDIVFMSVMWEHVAPERFQSKAFRNAVAPLGQLYPNMCYRAAVANMVRFLGYPEHVKATCFVMLLGETFHHEMKTVFVGCFRFSYSHGEVLVFKLIGSFVRLMLWILYKLLVSRRLAYVLNYVTAWTKHIKTLAEYVCEEDVNSVAKLIKEINPGLFSDKFLFGIYCMFMTEAYGCGLHQASVVYQYLYMLEHPTYQPDEDAWNENFKSVTSLHVAVACGHHANVSLIVNRMKRNIDVNAEGTLKNIDENPQTALMMACGTEPSEKSSQIVSLLLGHPKINVNAKTACGTTALKIAFRNALDDKCEETMEILELLLKNPKLDINEKVEEDKTPLMMAIDHMKGENRETVLDLILRHPLVDVNAIGDPSTGFIALHHAVEQDQPKIVETLLKVPKIKINAKTNDKETPLILAARLDRPSCLQIVKLLVSKKKVDVNAVDAEGYNVMWRAFNNKNHQVVEFLYNNKKFDKGFAAAVGMKLLENKEEKSLEVCDNLDNKRQEMDNDQGKENQKVVEVCDNSDNKIQEMDNDQGKENQKVEETVEKKSSCSVKCCWCCGVEDVKLYRCGGCKKAFYCGDKCIQADWQVHGGWCHKIKEKRMRKKNSVT